MQEKKNNIYFIVIPTALIFYLLHIIPSFSDTSYFWGTDMWRYFPKWFIIVTIGISAMSIIPIWGEKLFQWLDIILSTVKKILEPVPKWVLYIVFLTVSLTIFWILRLRTYFLGDSRLRLTDLALGERYSVFEPLDIFIHSVLYSLMNKFGNTDPAFVYGIISVVCGIIFIFIVVRFHSVIYTFSGKKYWINFS